MNDEQVVRLLKIGLFIAGFLAAVVIGVSLIKYL